MVLWPWVWLKPYKYDEYPREKYEDWYRELEERLFRHELQHCYQIQRKGRLKFYVCYLLLYLRYGYKNHPYEIEANKYETELLTETEKHWLVTGRVIL